MNGVSKHTCLFWEGADTTTKKVFKVLPKLKKEYEGLRIRILEPYSQHFIFFITYTWAQYGRFFVLWLIQTLTRLQSTT